LGGSDAWLTKPIADLASPICRCEDEPILLARLSVHAAEWQAVTELPDIR